MTKPRILSHLALSIENGCKNKFKGSILTPKMPLSLGISSILSVFQEQSDRLSSETSQFAATGSGYETDLF
jgi:hypothetical protein